MLREHAEAELANLQRDLIRFREGGDTDEAIMVAAEMYELQREHGIPRNYGLFRTLFSRESMKRTARPPTPEEMLVEDAEMLAMLPLDFYQRTPFWKVVERAIRERADGACEKCGVAGTRLIVRHTETGAGNRGMESADDTEAVCPECCGA